MVKLLQSQWKERRRPGDEIEQPKCVYSAKTEDIGINLNNGFISHPSAEPYRGGRVTHPLLVTLSGMGCDAGPPRKVGN